MDIQQGDVFLFQTTDDGEVNVENGIMEMRGSLETSAYLSLFGGNEDDNGQGDTSPFTWWGNLSENEPSKRQRSRTQHLLQSLPLTTANLLRVEDAVSFDLNWLKEQNIATDISIVASIPALNKLQLDISIDADGSTTEIRFIENWKRDIDQ